MILGLSKKRRRTPRRVSVGRLKVYDCKKIEEDWARVEQLVGTGKPSAFKEAVIVADKLLDYALKQIAPGESMGERLKNARDGFPRPLYQGLWDAHKVRNALVHDPNYDLTRLVAEGALEKFRAGFKHLGAKL
jgi:hypothetical protein